MGNEHKIIGPFIIASAIIWGMTIIFCALQLRSTVYYDNICLVLIGGTIAHLFFIWVPLTVLLKNKKEPIKKRFDKNGFHLNKREMM